MKNKRVVITGLGLVSSIGIGKDEFYENVIDNFLNADIRILHAYGRR